MILVTRLCEKEIVYGSVQKDIWRAQNVYLMVEVRPEWPKSPETVVQMFQERIRHMVGTAAVVGTESQHPVSVVHRDRSGPVRLATVVVGKVPGRDWKGWGLRLP